MPARVTASDSDHLRLRSSHVKRKLGKMSGPYFQVILHSSLLKITLPVFPRPLNWGGAPEKSNLFKYIYIYFTYNTKQGI